MKLIDAKNKAIKLIREWSNNGNLILPAKNLDYTLSMNDFADTAQKEIATVKKINASYSISQNPIKNQLGEHLPFNLVQHLDADVINSVAKGSKAYYFEVDRQCTVYVEEETATGVWTVLKTITVPSSNTSFTAYKGLISPSSALNNVRMRFSGSYPYNIRNRALYAYTFPTDNDVQIYRPWVKYDLPADFMELKKIVNETDPRLYVRLTDYKIEGKKTVLFNYSTKGSFTIEYYRYPTTIDSATADDYLFEVDTEAQEAIPYYIAAHVAMDEPNKQNMVSTYLNIYQGKLSNLPTNDNNNSSQTSNAMGW